MVMASKLPDSVQQQVDAVSAMDSDQLRNWIIELVERRDVILESDDEGGTFYPVLALCRLAEPAVQNHLADTLTDVLLDTIKSDELASESLENLLLLIQTLDVVESRDLLEAYVVSERFVMLASDLQYRILQTLIALNANLQPSFWYRVLKLRPDRFAGIVFDGLALVSPNHAVDFLSRAPITKEAVQQISVGFPGFMDDLVPPQERASVRSLVESRMTEMQPAIANAVADFFASEETPIAFLKLELETQSQQSRTTIRISADTFPVLATMEDQLDQILELKVHNPARLFRKLAHQ